ncbi:MULTISPECIES: hypothetical protein [Arthrobacter]|nr:MULTISPECIES: hypothetical protein [Arthrobacter]NYG19095.1 hypothetical protein [Arthrobacter psychrochitiniphilus]
MSSFMEAQEEEELNNGQSIDSSEVLPWAELSMAAGVNLKERTDGVP